MLLTTYLCVSMRAEEIWTGIGSHEFNTDLGLSDTCMDEIEVESIL